jgi:hypothetical protein
MLFVIKTQLLAILSLLFIGNAYSYTIYCYHDTSVPDNYNGYQGSLVNRCTGWYGYPATPVQFSHYQCGTAQLNVALYVAKVYKGYTTIGPGQTRSITPDKYTTPGSFEIRISLQSGTANPVGNTCRLEVSYIW